MRAIKCALLRICELLGMFALTSWLVARNRLQILCYHGFELRDESHFKPQLFITAATFSERLEHLRRSGCKVLALDDALRRVREGTLPPKPIVITIDDGFVSTLTVAAPLLKRFGFPATVYVTSYYMEKRVPVFRLAIQYIFWRAGAGTGEARLADELAANLTQIDWQAAETPMWCLIKHGEALASEDERQGLLRAVAAIANESVDSLYADRRLSLMTPEEVRRIVEEGVAVELHTHRHRFPSNDRDAACAEIDRNRASLQAATGKPASHFCYPSGVFDRAQWPWLEALGVQSATTCLPGMNGRDTPIYGLRRFLDSEDVRDVEFRAEVAGFNEVLRWIARRG